MGTHATLQVIAVATGERLVENQFLHRLRFRLISASQAHKLKLRSSALRVLVLRCFNAVQHKTPARVTRICDGPTAGTAHQVPHGQNRPATPNPTNQSSDRHRHALRVSPNRFPRDSSNKGVEAHAMHVLIVGGGMMDSGFRKNDGGTAWSRHFH
jgi:hypothetical protein